jgi:hypothetical protein
MRNCVESFESPEPGASEIHNTVNVCLITPPGYRTDFIAWDLTTAKLSPSSVIASKYFPFCATRFEGMVVILSSRIFCDVKPGKTSNSHSGSPGANYYN